MVVFAHYFGIDEVGVFVVPALLVLFALRWAEKRVARRSAEEDESLEDVNVD